MLFAASPVLAARLTGLAMQPGQITIVADGRPAVATQFALADPDRLVVDIPAVAPERLEAEGVGSVASLKAGMFAPGIVRLVIVLKAPLAIDKARSEANALIITLRRVSTDAFAAAVRRGRQPLPIDPDAGDGFDLPAELATPVPKPPVPKPPPPKPPATRPPASSAAEASVTASTGPPGPPSSTPPPVAAADDAPADDAIATAPAAAPATALPPPPSRRAPGVRPRSGALPLVVIDAGHGGKDVGAISVDGGYEKDVTLAIARATADALRRHGKVRVKLTRDDDRFIPLGGRVTIARQARADLFVSIHADSAPNPDARGASVYTLSAVASDAVAARLAARENRADIIGGVNLGQLAPEVGDIMIDLTRRATTNVSVAFADILQDELSPDVGFRSTFHHFAGFAVLKAPDVPSVLLETGYVSNRDDADRLFSDSGRRRIAAGIARAVERHLLGDRALPDRAAGD